MDHKSAKQRLTTNRKSDTSIDLIDHRIAAVSSTPLNLFDGVVTNGFCSATPLFIRPIQADGKFEYPNFEIQIRTG